jgi:hypothetical protein
MTPEEFEFRWRTIYYDRSVRQGLTVQPPPELRGALPRQVYGRSGRGRTAGFHFSSPYRVRTWKDGHEATFLVSRGIKDPIDPKLESERVGVEGHGTEIAGVEATSARMTAAEARSVLSTRFLTNPAFIVSVDGVQVTFSDVPSDSLAEIDVDVPDHGTAHITVIDTQRTDRTARQHGIAWWVNGRLVGQCGWRGSDQEAIIDGRTEEAKRFTFIVAADFLASSIEADWSDFRRNDPVWLATQPIVQAAIKEKFGEFTKDRRRETTETVTRAHRDAVATMPLVSGMRWRHFLDQVVEQCPGLGEKQISQLMGILASLEISESQYSLLDKLHMLKPSEFDQWNAVLETWTVQSAKIALDVIRDRLRLIEEIRARAADPNSDEVQQLQPLFKNGLWVFGPQFEAIEFTSNQGMTTVVRKLFSGKVKASRNRPDFVITPDSTVGFYARPSFDAEFNERGTEELVIVELKRPGVQIKDIEKAQVWKYVRELKDVGYVLDTTRVTGFVLGDSIHPSETGDRTEGPNVVIRPLLYTTFIGQAEKRMLTLHEKLRNSPMMQAAIAEFSQVPELPTQSKMDFPPQTKRMRNPRGIASPAFANSSPTRPDP